MRRVLEMFAEAGWIQNSALTTDQLLFTPTSEGLDAVPHLERVLREINDDPTGELAACTLHLCQQVSASDNYAESEDSIMERTQAGIESDLKAKNGKGA